MTRIPRCLLVLVLTATLALVSVPIAGARPLETSLAAARTEGGWLGAALRWLEKVAVVHFSAPGRYKQANDSPDTGKKDGYFPTGGSCIDPQGGGPHCGT
jgi:hypothetical protein